MNTEVLKMKPEYTGQRVDRQLSELMPELSRSYIQKLLKEGMVLANGKPVKANYKLNGKEELTVTIPDAAEPDIEPENIPLDILYESSGGKQTKRHGSPPGCRPLQRHSG